MHRYAIAAVFMYLIIQLMFDNGIYNIIECVWCILMLAVSYAYIMMNQESGYAMIKWGILCVY